MVSACAHNHFIFVFVLMSAPLLVPLHVRCGTTCNAEIDLKSWSLLNTTNHVVEEKPALFMVTNDESSSKTTTFLKPFLIRCCVNKTLDHNTLLLPPNLYETYDFQLFNSLVFNLWFVRMSNKACELTKVVLSPLR